MRVSGGDAAPICGHPIRRQFTGAELAWQHLFVDSDRAVWRDHGPARVRELGAAYQPRASHGLHKTGGPFLSGHRLCDRCGDWNLRRTLPVGPGVRPNFTGRQEINFVAETMLSLISPLVELVVFLLLLQELITLTDARAP